MKSSVGRLPSTSVVWCAVDTIRFWSSTGPMASGLRSLSNTLQRRSLTVIELPRATRLAVASDEDGLRLGREPTLPGAYLLVQRDARRADPLEPTGSDDPFVHEPELAPEVDRDARQHVVPLVAHAAEDTRDPFVPALLEIRRVHGIVDVLVGVDVPPADLDPFLVHHRSRCYGENAHRARGACPSLPALARGRGRLSPEHRGRRDRRSQRCARMGR